jgi:alpha-glucosidase
MDPGTLPLVRDLIRFRYRLIPYLYALLVESAQTGHPIARPLVYHFAHDPRCRTESFDFMLGPNLLVAPILEPGLRARQVYLPAGVGWYDWHSGEFFRGGQTIQAAAPLERIPLFVPEGGILPLGKVMGHVGAEPDDEREAWVFPPAGTGTARFTLIEDDGISLGWQRGEQSAVRLQVTATAETLALAIHLDQRGYPLPYPAITFVLPPGETRPIHAPGSTQYAGSDGRRRIRVMVPGA